MTTPPSAAVPARRGFGLLDGCALLLMVLGALNWAAVGLLGHDFVALLFGGHTQLTRAVYLLIGLAGMYGLSFAFRCYHPF
ncbi:DUF378 domain-containing protein [Pseudorhodoferax soli]|jgi:uncharacterized membrane protein YuzA (DUF378 family)|uniref:DUF378 domain-containing protein n=1 Tax=Pseudorhodoferax soli TaxID=545864 RepID=A0A368XWZ1_9BURK|nr:DUF378 domain-containing protein [Pseudorhodoferax soli]RCW72493.1 hypothetical protein DES41_10398 [Pseudorhodoferax soli]